MPAGQGKQIWEWRLSVSRVKARTRPIAGVFQAGDIDIVYTGHTGGIHGVYRGHTGGKAQAMEEIGIYEPPRSAGKARGL